MTEEFEDYKDFKDTKRSFFGNISPTTWVFLLIIGVLTYYLFIASRAGNKDFIGLIIIVGIIMYGISQSGSKNQVRYINSETAREILMEWLKNYKKLGKDKICKITLPKGFVEIGFPAKEFNPFDMKTPKSWQIGFTVYDEDDESNPKYFLAKIDPVMGGTGLEEIQKVDEEFNGIIKPIAKEYVVVTPEKYAEIKGIR